MYNVFTPIKCMYKSSVLHLKTLARLEFKARYCIC